MIKKYQNLKKKRIFSLIMMIMKTIINRLHRGVQLPTKGPTNKMPPTINPPNMKNAKY